MIFFSFLFILDAIVVPPSLKQSILIFHGQKSKKPRFSSKIDVFNEENLDFLYDPLEVS